jgi:alpha-2-macroglobulin
MFKRSLISFIIIFVFIVFFSGCSGKPDSDTQIVNNHHLEYVKSVTTGYVDTQTEIKVVFQKPVSSDFNNPGDSGKLLTIRPKVKGSYIWEDRHTLIFTPEKPLKQDTSYTCKLDLSHPFIELKGLSPFIFSIQTEKREIINLDGAFVHNDPENPSSVIYEGVIALNEDVPLNIISRAVSLTVEEKKIPLKWEFKNSQFHFTSKVVNRGKEPKNYQLVVNGNKAGTGSNSRNSGILPSLDVLDVMQIKTMENVKEPGLTIEFSDKVDARQSLEGLIQVSPELDLSFVVKDNNVLILGDFQPGTNYTVNVAKGIISSSSTRTEKERVLNIRFENIGPQLRFMSDGVFLPSDNQKKLRFRTINVRNVHLEVKRVFENNLGQFLQTEKLESLSSRNSQFNNQYVRRVGIVAAEMDLEISEDENVWLQHEIDLENLIRPSKNDVFLISLSFERDDMIYPLQSSTRYYSGSAYYTNPNSRGYLRANGQIYKPIIFNDLGLTVKKHGGGYLAFVSDLSKASPVRSAQVVLKTYQNQEIARGTSDSSGFVEFPNTGSVPFFITAEKGNSRAVIKTNEMAWNLSSFDIGGHEVESGAVRAFVFADRGVHRPGDDIHLSSIIRNNDGTFPNGHPVTLKLINPRGQTVLEQINREGIDGFYVFNIKTESTDPTGKWIAQVEAGSKTFSHTLPIEEVVPNRIKVILNPDLLTLGPDDNKLSVELESRYLFGTPASSLKAKMHVLIQHNKKTFSKFPGFQFDNELIKFKELTLKMFEGSLDENGRYSASLSLPDLSLAPSALNGTITATVEEKGGRSVRNRYIIPIDPHEAYLGLEKPKLDFGSAKVGVELPINSILVSENGVPISGKKITYSLYKNSRYWWWEYDSRDDYLMRYKSDSHTELVEQGNLQSGRSPGSFRITPGSWGQYYVEVSAEGTSHTAGFFFYASSWRGGQGNADGADLILLDTDKAEYKPGDKATIRVPMPEDGGILLTVENNNGILSSKWIPAERNRGEIQEIEIPITDKMIPNAYASVSVIQEHSQTANDRPIRIYGLVPLMVKDPGSKQTLKIMTESEFTPGEDFTVTVQTEDRKETQMVIAVVDEGLLDLTSFKTPNPEDEFFRKLKLNSTTWDIYSHVIDAHKGDLFKQFSVGGGYGQGIVSDGGKDQRRFPPVALFEGPVSTDRNGRAKVTFTMPEYLGSVRIMVVSTKGGRYGNAEKSVPVREDLILLPTLPRVIGPGDSFEVPITLFSMSDQIQNVRLSIEAEGAVSTSGPTMRNVTVPPNGEYDTEFKLKALEAIGTGTVIIKAKSGGKQFIQKIFLPVRASSPRIYSSDKRDIKPGYSAAFKIPDRGLAGSNESTVSISRLADLNLDNRLYWLIRYPYGCIEQTTSAVFPQLYLGKVLSTGNDDLDVIDHNISAGIERLRSFQVASGGFSYWPGGSSASIWGTNYAGHFLIEAKSIGYHVPEALYSRWLNYQHSQALSTSGNLTEQLYRIYLLSLAGDPSLSSMNILKVNELSKMNDVQKWMLAGAYELAGFTDIARDITRISGISVANYQETGRTYGSTLRDKGMILEKLLLFNNSRQSNLLYHEITESLSGSQWYSTQTLGYSLMAVGKYIRKYESASSGSPRLKGTVILPDGRRESFDTRDLKVTYSFNGYPGAGIQVDIDRATSVPNAFVNFEWSGVPLRYEDAAENSNSAGNLGVLVEWYDEEGIRSINPELIEQGTVFWGKIKASNIRMAELEELALVLILPAGWEIENTRLSGEGYPEALRSRMLGKEEYLDIRDDRIMWFFDMKNRTRDLEFLVKLRAVTQGTFVMPPVLFEAMYDRNYQIIKGGGTVQVVESGAISHYERVPRNY